MKKNALKNPSKKTKVYGLTGGIGSGKSLAASFFRKSGIPVINLDEIGRKISEHNASLAKKVSSLCGESVHHGDHFDRARVREIVFRSPKKRKQLEKLFHPLIWREYRRQLAAEIRRGKKIIICEAALLIENHHAHSFDGLIVVMAPKSVRSRRVKKRDPGANKWLKSVYATQVSDTVRRKKATYLLYNYQTKKVLAKQIKHLLMEWRGHQLQRAAR